MDTSAMGIAKGDDVIMSGYDDEELRWETEVAVRMGAMVKIRTRTLRFCCYPGIELARNLSSVCI